jgi:hypothetical protein
MTAATVDVDCPRCGSTIPVTVSFGPSLDTDEGHEVLLHVDELEQVPHFLTCASRPDPT